ncbi:hypothetical protein J3R30DRAFT_872748 [Lentinula aciculospora]|uniref:Uncharacterized protein n=1 Tax=Lentinula aciculospora TaxID=153920 RepID=A0A9W9AQN7_9AGAR|nr:hypothetical protein J3R30DRAFT_872748 [Lentinula aciculospora]
MDLDQPSSSASDSDVEIVQSKLSARKTKSQRNEEDSPEEVGFSATISSDEESVEEGDDDQEEPVSDSESEQEQESGDPDVDVIGDNIGTESMSEPSVALIEAIKPFLPRIPARNLPFLKRNLRTAFKKSFSTSIGSPSGAVVLQVLLRASSDQSRWSFSLDSWSCPLCHLLGELDSRQMLDFHLQWHHPGVEVLWLREKDPEWRLILSFPVLSTSHIERPVAPYFRYAFIKKTVDIADHDAQGNQSITSLTMEDELDSDVDADISVRMSPVPTPKIEFASPSSISISLSPPRGRSITTAEGPHPTPLDPQYPLPPPADNPLGPAARYPYLPAISDDGKIVLHYSCRAGGPYLYDLLGLLPLDEYGVLSWLVLDREAEIFENEDISDECKVMHALWDRWIMMNRRRFIQDYLVGTIDFVDKYWLMIHRAAGWSALRYWLVVDAHGKSLFASKRSGPRLEALRREDRNEVLVQRVYVEINLQRRRKQ